MTAKKKLITCLANGNTKAIEFVEAIREIFNDHDQGIRLFGSAFPEKFDADYSYLQSQIVIKNMNRSIDNPKPGMELEFTYKDQLEFLLAIKEYKLERKRAYLNDIMNLANYHSK